MKRNSSTTVLICGLITMVVTIIFYLLAFNNILTLPMRWLSLLCLLIVEVIGTVKALKLTTGIFGVANMTVSIVHLGAVFVVSLIFVNILPFFIKQYILIYLLLFAAAAVVDIVLLRFGERAKEANRAYQNTASVIEECLLTAQKLAMDASTTEYKKQLDEIVESIKYSNKTVLCGNEMDILSKLGELRGAILVEGEGDVQGIMKQLQDMIKLRAIQTKTKGSF